MKNEDDERIERALDWCKNRNLRSKQLNLFDKRFKKKKIRENLSKKEFKKMCKKARVDQKFLCKTVFTESLKSS